MKHAPGPWKLREDIGCVYDKDEKPIMSAGCSGNQESYANVVLISVAPDLLKACKALLILVEGDPPLYDEVVCDAARGLVNKAEGRG